MHILSERLEGLSELYEGDKKDKQAANASSTIHMQYYSISYSAYILRIFLPYLT